VAAPEPSTWAMMFAGLGMLVFSLALKRRQNL
jgi:PEP-CTERM motif